LFSLALEEYSLRVSYKQLSTHVIARSIVQYARSRGSTLVYPTGSNEQFGSGIVGDVGGERVFVGKESYLKDHGVIVSDEVHSTIVAIQREGNMVTCIGIGTACVGYIVCEDVVRPEVKQIIAAIHAQGLETLLITGDSTERAEAVRAQTGVSQVLADCLPEDKAGKVQAYEAAHKPVVMVGDGINDAPALAAATVGIAMGVHGETATTQSAQAVIMVDDIARVADLISISKKTMHIARQSIGAGIGLSVIAMVVALLGYLPPVLGAFIQEGIDVAVILNALRVLRA
jgi:P-type E1-E2 ATPase